MGTYGELLVLLVVVEVAEEREELVLVAAEDRLDLRRLLRVCDKDLQFTNAITDPFRLLIRQKIKHLKYMECLELDIFALVAQQVHHHLQVGVVREVPRHDGQVGAIK